MDEIYISGKPVGETILYFGCRKKSEDFIYEEELNEFVKNGSLKVNYNFFFFSWTFFFSSIFVIILSWSVDF